MRHASRWDIAAWLALAWCTGCDCGGAVSGGDADGASDGVFDPAGETDGERPDVGGDADGDSDARVDADGEEDGFVEAEAWPDAPEVCEWYQLRSEWGGPCDGSGDSWLFDGFYAPGDEPILRVVAVYEAASDLGPPGTLTVRLRRTYRPVVLALGSYETVTWIIEREEGARLDRVYVYGYDPQIVVGADDVPVVNHSPGGRSPGYCYPFCSEHDTRSDLAAIEAEVGLPVRSFDGCYEATGLTLGDVCREECRESVACAGRECGLVPVCGIECGACAEGEWCDGWSCATCTPSCAGRECGPDGCGGSCGGCADDLLCDGSGACVAEATFPGCGGVTAESHYCLTLSEGQPALFGLDSGTVCTFGKPDLDLMSSDGPSSASIGWADGSLYVCVDRPGLHGLVRYDVLADRVSLAPVPCDGVATWRGGLVAMLYRSWAEMDLHHFTSFDDALDGVGEVLWWLRNSRMTVHGDLLYSAWHSTSEVDVQSLPGGAAVRTIRLAGYDDWIWGMSVTDDGLLVINPGHSDVVIFDEATGAWVADVHPTASVGPLACFVGP